MDMLPPQAPPAIISSVNQPERDALQRLAETQAWLYAQQDELPDPYVASDETENLFLLDIDAFWRTDTVDTPLSGQTGMSRRQALGAHLARAARDNATLLAGHGLLSPTAIDIVRRATGPDRTKLPTLHLSELLIGQTPQAGTLILQDDHAPDIVLLFGTRTGWESFQSLDELLCEVEERLQLQLFHADDELAIDEVDAHFLRALPLEAPPFDTIADRIIAAYRDSVARMWTGNILSSDWEDRLNEAMQLASIFDLHRLGALPGNVYPISPTTSSSLLKRGRRAAPTGASLGAASGAARRTGTARGVAEHLGPVPGTAQRMAGSVARHLGVGVPRSPTMTPPTSTLPRPQDMFSRRYSAPEVMLPAGPTPADSVYRLDGSSYVQHNGLPYRVQYDPVGNAWRLSSRGPTHGANTGPIIDLGPDGRWEIQFPAPHAATAPIPVQRTPVESPVHHMSESNTGGSHTVPAWPSVDVLPATPVASGTSTPMQPIDLPSGSLSELPKILKDIMREELTRQLDNSVVGALTLFRRVRRWHDGVDSTIRLGSDDIDAWNAAMRNMRDRMDQVVNVPSPGMPAASHVTDSLPGPETSDDLLARARTGDLSDTGEATLSELLVTHSMTVPVENLTPETLDAWSNAANEFVAQPRLVSSPAPHSSASPAFTANGATASILNKTLPIYPFDRPRLNDRALMLEEMGRLMPSQAAAEALLKRMQDAYLADGSVPRLSRMEENAWRGAVAHLDLPQPSKYRARRMDAAELPHRSLESARSRQNYFVTAGKTATPFDRLMYLRDKQGELIHLTTAEQDEWRSLLDFIRNKRGSTADVGLPSKRYRPELGDLAIADIRTIQRRLEKRFGKEAQEEIFKHNALSGPISRPLTDAEERAWREALTEVRERPSHFESDIPSEAIRDFSTDDMRELWRELRSRTGSRRAQTIYRTHALRQLPDGQPPLSTVVAPQWQPAVDAVRLRRRAPPPASMTLEEVSRALWHVPQEAWPTTLYHYVPAATLADATDHVIRLPITRLESLGADGIPVFTSPPNTATLDLPTRHTALLPDQAPGLVPDASAPPGSIGGRSGTWVQFNPTEVRESLETFVELYRVGGPTSTSFVLRPTQQSVAVGFTELWLNTPFVIHRPLP